MSKNLSLSLIMVGTWVCFQSIAFAQSIPTGGQRIAQPIVVNGQQAQGVLVVQNGNVQAFTCSSPQEYVTADQSSSGWACFEAATGVWLLHAQPPQQQAAPQAFPAPTQTSPAPPPTVVYGAPLPAYGPAPAVPVYGYYPYDYYSTYSPYSYYPYGYYPYVVGPPFRRGFGFGYRAPIVQPRPFTGGSFARAGGRVSAGRSGGGRR